MNSTTLVHWGDTVIMVPAKTENTPVNHKTTKAIPVVLFYGSCTPKWIPERTVV